MKQEGGKQLLLVALVLSFDWKGREGEKETPSMKKCIVALLNVNITQQSSFFISEEKRKKIHVGWFKFLVELCLKDTRVNVLTAAFQLWLWQTGNILCSVELNLKQNN